MTGSWVALSWVVDQEPCEFCDRDSEGMFRDGDLWHFACTPCGVVNSSPDTCEPTDTTP